MAVTDRQQGKLAEMEAAARLLQDMPALAHPHHILMGATSLANAFTCQPQQRNMQGAVFGGFLMR
jgi:acyl-coenzyme A thioesterase 9